MYCLGLLNGNLQGAEVEQRGGTGRWVVWVIICLYM